MAGKSLAEIQCMAGSRFGLLLCLLGWPSRAIPKTKATTHTLWCCVCSCCWDPGPPNPKSPNAPTKHNIPHKGHTQLTTHTTHTTYIAHTPHTPHTTHTTHTPHTTHHTTHNTQHTPHIHTMHNTQHITENTHNTQLRASNTKNPHGQQELQNGQTTRIEAEWPTQTPKWSKRNSTWSNNTIPYSKHAHLCSQSLSYGRGDAHAVSERIRPRRNVSEENVGSTLRSPQAVLYPSHYVVAAAAATRLDAFAMHSGEAHRTTGST
jgi:hypothetical protein